MFRVLALNKAKRARNAFDLAAALNPNFRLDRARYFYEGRNIVYTLDPLPTESVRFVLLKFRY